MTFEEKTLNSKHIYEGAIINLRCDEVTVQNGTSKREIIEHNGGAVLAAITDQGKMVMVKEETGYTASEVSFLTKFYPSVGYSEEILYLYLCTGLTPGETDFDENEAIDIREYEIEELYQMAMSGQLEDAKTIIAVLIVHSLKQEGRLPGSTKA